MKSRPLIFTLAIIMLAALPALADWQTATVGTGNNVQGIAIDPVRNRIFTANNTDVTVTVVDGQTNAVQTWTAGDRPSCITVNPITGKLYVSIGNGSATTDTVVVFDATGAIINRLPVKRNPYSMVLDLDSNRLYVANYNSDTISIYQNDVFLRDVAVKDAPRCLAINPINGSVYVAYNNSDSVSVITSGGLSISQIRSGERAVAVTVNASVNKAYVANASEDSVTVINCATNAVEKKILVGDYPVSLVSDPAAKQVYAANYFSGTITAINCSTNTVNSTALVKNNPRRMAINPITRKLYVGNEDAIPTLMILDWRGGIKIDSMALGHAIGAMALNPVTNNIYVVMDAGTTDSLAVIDGSDYDTTIVAAQSYPIAATVNPVTGDAYFANSGNNNVTVIKANGDTLTITVGDGPSAAAVNPLTNKIFVCNNGSKSVSVIDGATYTVERTITVDSLPRAVAVNPLTNYIYVGYNLSTANRIKVIDGKDWDTTSIQVGLRPAAIAVNSATNRIYVGNGASNTVSVIDGAHHTLLATVAAGNQPVFIDINPVTNKIYCANYSSGNVTVIDGATNNRTNVAVGSIPYAIAVNKANNKIYVSNFNGLTVSEIDGATNTTTTIPVGTNPQGIGVDPVTGKVFVCNSGSSNVSIIDCASRSVKTMATPVPKSLAVNPITSKAYVACSATNGKVLVIDQTVEQDTRVNTYDYTPAPWDKIFPGSTQNRPMTTINQWSPFKTKINSGLFSLATSQSFWKYYSNSETTDSSLTWLTGNNWGSDTAFYGENIFRRWGLETQGATTNNLGTGTPFAGNVLSSAVYRIDCAGPTIAWWDSLADDNDSLDGYGPYTVRALITDFSGVDSAILFYYNSTKVWPSVLMSRVLADTFTAEIPVQVVAFEDTASISYCIMVWDHADYANSTTTSTRLFKLRNPNGVAGNPAGAAMPKTFALQAAYPNPSRGHTVIKYQLPKASPVSLGIYNIAGQLVQRFDQGSQQPGYHSVRWDTSRHPAGVYFYRLRAGSFESTKKLVVVK